MDSPIHINAIRIGSFIIYWKGPQVEISLLWCISVPEDIIFVNNAVTDYMSHSVQFHWGLHYLPKYFICLEYKKANIIVSKIDADEMRIVVNKHGLGYLDFGRAGSISWQLYSTYHRLLHVRVAVNSHALPVHKKIESPYYYASLNL